MKITTAFASWGSYDLDDPFPLFAQARQLGGVHPVTLADPPGDLHWRHGDGLVLRGLSELPVIPGAALPARQFRSSSAWSAREQGPQRRRQSGPCPRLVPTYEVSGPRQAQLAQRRGGQAGRITGLAENDDVLV